MTSIAAGTNQLRRAIFPSGPDKAPWQHTLDAVKEQIPLGADKKKLGIV